MGQSSCKKADSSCKELRCCQNNNSEENVSKEYIPTSNCRSRKGVVHQPNIDVCADARSVYEDYCSVYRDETIKGLRSVLTPSCKIKTNTTPAFWDGVVANGFVVDSACDVNSTIHSNSQKTRMVALEMGCDLAHAVAHCNTTDNLGKKDNIIELSSKTFEARYGACLLSQGCADVQCVCDANNCSNCKEIDLNPSESPSKHTAVFDIENQMTRLRTLQDQERNNDVVRRKDVEPCFSGLQWSTIVGEQLDNRCTTASVPNNPREQRQWKQRCEALAARLQVDFSVVEPTTHGRVLPFGCIADGMPEYAWDPDTKTFENVAAKGSISKIRYVKWKSGTTPLRVAGTCVDDYGGGPAGTHTTKTDCEGSGFRWVPHWYSLCLSGPNAAHADLQEPFNNRSWHVLDADANQPHVCEGIDDDTHKDKADCTDHGGTWVGKNYVVSPTTSSLLELETVEATMVTVLADVEEKIWANVQACDARCVQRYPPAENAENAENCVGWKNRALGYCRRGCGVEWGTETTKSCTSNDTTVPGILTREDALAHLTRAGTNEPATWGEGVFKGSTADFPATGCGSGDDRVACEYGFGFWREPVMATNTEVSSPTMSPLDCKWEAALQENCHLKSSSKQRSDCFSRHACRDVECTSASNNASRVCVPPVVKRPTYPVLKIDVTYTGTEHDVSGYNDKLSTCDAWMDKTLFGDYDEATRTKYRDACRNGARMLPLPEEVQKAVLMPAEYSEEDRCTQPVVWVSGDEGQSCDDVCGAQQTNSGGPIRCSVDDLRNMYQVPDDNGKHHGKYHFYEHNSSETKSSICNQFWTTTGTGTGRLRSQMLRDMCSKYNAGQSYLHPNDVTCDSKFDTIRRVCPCRSNPLRNLNRHECQSFAVHNGKVWEDLTPIYAYLQNEEQAPVARGVFEGTQTSASKACDDNTDCTDTLSAGNGNLWMMCNKQNILCPDAFAPAAPACEQSEWSKANNRQFEVSDNKVDCENQKFFASSFDECESMVNNMNFYGGLVPFPGGLGKPYAHTRVNVTFSNGKCRMNGYGNRELFAPDGLWVENRTYDPIGCSLNSDGKVVFRSQDTAKTNKRSQPRFYHSLASPVQPMCFGSTSGETPIWYKYKDKFHFACHNAERNCRVKPNKEQSQCPVKDQQCPDENIGAGGIIVDDGLSQANVDICCDCALGECGGGVGRYNKAYCGWQSSEYYCTRAKAKERGCQWTPYT